MMQSLLSILIWLPIAGGFAVLALGTHRAKEARWLALAMAVATFVVSIPLLTSYDAAAGTMQFIEQHRWIEASEQIGIVAAALERAAAQIDESAMALK